jgi:hypothetical protein
MLHLTVLPHNHLHTQICPNHVFKLFGDSPISGLEAVAHGNKRIVYGCLLISIVHITHNAPSFTPPPPTCDSGKIRAALPDSCPPPPAINHPSNQISQHSFPNWNNPRLEVSPKTRKQNSSYIYVSDFRFRSNSEVGNPVPIVYASCDWSVMHEETNKRVCAEAQSLIWCLKLVTSSAFCVFVLVRCATYSGLHNRLSRLMSAKSDNDLHIFNINIPLCYTSCKIVTYAIDISNCITLAK